MKLQQLKNIKNYSFLIIPNYHGIQTHSYKISSLRVILLLSSYTLFVGFIFYILFSMSDVGSANSPNKISASGRPSEIDLLNKKVYILTKEIESISSLNKKLRLAIKLGDSTFIDSMQKVNKSKENKVNPYGGNLFAVLQNLFFKANIDSNNFVYFLKPVSDGFISKKFDAERGHFGIDFAVKTGTPVLAASGGYVIFADYTANDGYMIIIQHHDNYTTVYKHCSQLTKKLRDYIFQGEVIALSGNTGYNTSGPHLHFELWKDGQAINPQNLILN